MINQQAERNLNTTHELINLSQRLLNKILDIVPITAQKLKDSACADRELISISNNLDLFIQLVIEVHHSIDASTKERLETTTSLKQLKIHLLSVVKAIFQAKKKSDNIMLCDLIEFELKDNLTKWKINVIPQIKKSLSL
jgi:hypothetical protein